MPDIIPAFDQNKFLDFSGNCLEASDFQTAFDYINCLAVEMEKGTSDMDCEDFEVVLSANTGAAGGSIELVEGYSVPPSELATETCYFFMNYSTSIDLGGLNFPAISASATVNIRCGNLIMKTESFSLFGDQREAFFSAECIRGEPITMDATGTFNVSGTSDSDDTNPPNFLPFSIRLCGGRLCTSVRDISQPNAYAPPVVQPGCQYGLGTLAGLAANLNALRAAYSFAGWRVDTYAIRTIGPNGSSPVGPVNDTNTIWAVFGYTRIAFDDQFRSTDSVDMKVQVGCQSNASSCLSTNLSPRLPTYLRLGADCAMAPFSGCGECPAGEQIFVGQNPTLSCVERGQLEPAPDDGGFNAETVYCVAVFSEVIPDELASGVSLPYKYPSLDYLQSLNDEIGTIHQIACDRVVAGVLSDEQVYSGPLGNVVSNPETQFVIRPASAPPPVTNPPTPIPNHKRFYTGSLRILSTRPGGNAPLEDQTRVRVTWEIICDGVVETCNHIYTIADSGLFSGSSASFQIAGLPNCPITSPIEFRIKTFSIGTSFSAIQFNLSYTLTLRERAFINDA